MHHSHNIKKSILIFQLFYQSSLHHTKRRSFDDFGFNTDAIKALKEAVRTNNFVVILQCGGFGIRLGGPGPKHLRDLEDSSKIESVEQQEIPIQESLFQFLI